MVMAVQVELGGWGSFSLDQMRSKTLAIFAFFDSISSGLTDERLHFLATIDETYRRKGAVVVAIVSVDDTDYSSKQRGRNAIVEKATHLDLNYPVLADLGGRAARAFRFYDIDKRQSQNALIAFKENAVTYRGLAHNYELPPEIMLLLQAL